METFLFYVLKIKTIVCFFLSFELYHLQQQWEEKKRTISHIGMELKKPWPDKGQITAPAPKWGFWSMSQHLKKTKKQKNKKKTLPPICLIFFHSSRHQLPGMVIYLTGQPHLFHEVLLWLKLLRSFHCICVLVCTWTNNTKKKSYLYTKFSSIKRCYFLKLKIMRFNQRLLLKKENITVINILLSNLFLPAMG